MRNKLYHILFGGSLITLIALAIWWIVLHSTQVDSVFAGQLAMLKLETIQKAGELSQIKREQKLPTLEDDSKFKIVATKSTNDENAISLAPNWPEYSLLLKKQAVQAMYEKHSRRRVMIYGEGTLLMVLVFICVIMLYRLLLAEQKTKSEMQTFFHAVSHELKTPIAGVKALLETIQGGNIKPEELGRYTGLGLKEVNRLQRLVENVLLANRIDQNVFISRKTDVELLETVERIVNSRNRIFADSPTVIENKCKQDTRVQADPDLLQHVIRNLLDNAYKYSGDDAKVKVVLNEDKNWCTVDVIDNGIGFDLNDKQLLYKKFYRLKDAEDKKIKGNGLGLFIAKTLVGSIGGKLEARSDGKDKGSVFTIRLLRVNDNE